MIYHLVVSHIQQGGRKWGRGADTLCPDRAQLVVGEVECLLLLCMHNEVTLPHEAAGSARSGHSARENWSELICKHGTHVSAVSASCHQQDCICGSAVHMLHLDI